MIGVTWVNSVKDNSTVKAITVTLLKTEHTTTCCRHFWEDSKWVYILVKYC